MQLANFYAQNITPTNPLLPIFVPKVGAPLLPNQSHFPTFLFRESGKWDGKVGGFWWGKS